MGIGIAQIGMSNLKHSPYANFAFIKFSLQKSCMYYQNIPSKIFCLDQQCRALFDKYVRLSLESMKYKFTFPATNDSLVK